MVASGGTGGTYTLENYNYDSSSGNLTSKAGVSLGYGQQSGGCQEGALTKAHAVTSAGSNSYCYDQNGNMRRRTIGGVTYSLTYDAENHMTAMSGGSVSATFDYDGDGQRVKGTINGAITTYIHNYFEWTGSTSSMKKYYYDGATRVAMRTGNSTGQTTGLNWLLNDHLGSTSITADSGGNRSGELRYKGWGEIRFTSGTTPTSFQFTGQRNESTLGLYFYNSRWFDPALGRFIQADPVVPSLANSQAFDRYAYVLNNPTNNVDPSGHRPCNGEDNSDRCVSDPGWNKKPQPTSHQAWWGWQSLLELYKMLKADTSGWWNTAFGNHHTFDIWDFAALLLSIEAGANLSHAFIEGAVRAFWGWCKAVGCSGNTLQAILMWLAANFAGKTRLENIEEKGSTLEKEFPPPQSDSRLLTELAYSFRYPPLEWQKGWDPNRPYYWGNFSLYPPEVQALLMKNIKSLYIYGDAMDIGSRFLVPSGCVWHYWLDPYHRDLSVQCPAVS